MQCLKARITTITTIMTIVNVSNIQQGYINKDFMHNEIKIINFTYV
jgi:hypothetical protein